MFNALDGCSPPGSVGVSRVAELERQARLIVDLRERLSAVVLGLPMPHQADEWRGLASNSFAQAIIEQRDLLGREVKRLFAVHDQLRFAIHEAHRAHGPTGLP